jgi:PPP family 3-phenylpropionic acid transporter
MAYCCIMAFAGVFLLSRGFSNAEVGLTLTIAGGLTLISQPIVAAFADRTRRLTLGQIVAGLLVVCLLAGLLLMMTPALVLPTAVLYILLFCAFGCQGSLVTSLAMEHVNAGAPLNFSLARGIGSFAFAVLALVLGNLVVSLVGLVFVLVLIERPKTMLAGTHASAPLTKNEAV